MLLGTILGLPANDNLIHRYFQASVSVPFGAILRMWFANTGR